MTPQPLETINDLTGLQVWLDHHCKSKGHPCWHHYGPADLSLYETQPPNIMIVNSESGGYRGCEGVPSDEYLKWIKGGVKRWPTPRYGSLLVTFIRRYAREVREGKTPAQFDRAMFSRIYQDTDVLVENMRATIYMNARITSNDSNTPHEQKAAVMSDAREFGAYRRRFLEILRPDIVICAGASARDAVFHSGGAFEPSELACDAVFSTRQCSVIVIPHLSRPGLFGGYANLHEVAHKCVALHADRTRESASATTVEMRS